MTKKELKPFKDLDEARAALIKSLRENDSKTFIEIYKACLQSK